MKSTSYLDYLRVYACIAVVFMNTSADLLATASMNINWHLANGFVCVAFTAVPIFFMISGYLILSSDRTNDIKYLFKHRIPCLLIPFIAWSIMIVIWQLYHVGEFGIKFFVKELIDELLSLVMNHLWFMYTLFNIIMCTFVSVTVASVKHICYFFTGLKFENAKHICNWYSVFSLIQQTYKHNIKNRKVY